MPTELLPGKRTIVDGNVVALRSVLVLYTGGTIGMKKVNGFYTPQPAVFLKKIKSYADLYDEKFTRSILPNVDGDLDENVMAVPNVVPGRSIVYRLVEYDPLIDSSNMSMDGWKRISSDIQANYDKYDGFVVLHGTDTMAYTASALSFMFDGLAKCVVITGSQIPIFERRSDAKDNFYSSLIYASSIRFDVPEVCVCFAGKLLRGNRTIKYSSDALEAFRSPNYPSLGRVRAMEHKVLKEYVRRIDAAVPFRVTTNLENRIAILQMFPGIPTVTVEALLNSVRGVVLLTYGTGNLPSSRPKLFNLLRKARENEILLVNCTQCANGNMYDTYETAKELAEMGIVSGRDMTTEAALAKLAYVLALPGLTYEDRQKMMKTDMRGELTKHDDYHYPKNENKVNDNN